MKEQDREQLEQQIRDVLEAGELREEEAGNAARKRMIPQVEIRVAGERDPVEEETARYREMADEVDERYDRRRNRKP